MLPSQWNGALTTCGVRLATATRWSNAFSDVVTPEAFSAGLRDVRAFVAQILHESAMLESLEENLNYSAERLMAVWPRRFPDMTTALAYARNPEALANFVYGGRLGNTEPGDGWKYRGRGAVQITGRDNYALVERLSGLPLLANPELLKDPHAALRASVAWWEQRVDDALLDDVERVTMAVNGGTTGLADRQRLAVLLDRVVVA